jgi:pteridine reductase
MRALITGGTGRVGSAIAQRLERDGWKVLAPGRADGDLAEVEQARALVARAVEELGGLDLLVNAAGEGFAPKPLEELDEHDWDAAFGVTAKGSFFVSQAAAPHLRASHGCIVMIEDVAGYQPWPSFAAHSAAKAAQSMLTRVLARALAPEVRVCGVAPGPVAVEPGQEERRDPARSRRLARGRRRRRRVPGGCPVRHRIDPGRRRRTVAQNRLASRDVETFRWSLCWTVLACRAHR